MSWMTPNVSKTLEMALTDGMNHFGNQDNILHLHLIKDGTCLVVIKCVQLIS